MNHDILKQKDRAGGQQKKDFRVGGQHDGQI